MPQKISISATASPISIGIATDCPTDNVAIVCPNICTATTAVPV